MIDTANCDTLLCIVCGKQVKEIEHFSDDPAMNWWGGVVEWVTAGYGSKHDTDRILVCICDDCIAAKREAGVLVSQAWEPPPLEEDA